MRPAALCPSILSFPPASLAEPVRELMSGGADWIHLDVMDGQFVPIITFGADLAAQVCAIGDTPVEAHLMTLTPERHFEAFVKGGCRRVIFHAEATRHAHRHCTELKAMGVEAGVAINPGTPVEALTPLLEVMDFALVMTVNPGWGGQQLISSCLHKVAALRKLRPDLAIEVDGGIDPRTAPAGVRAGADHFVAGSFLAKSESIAAGLAELRQACASK